MPFGTRPVPKPAPKTASKTKNRPAPRVRHEPPTIEEAVSAARDLSDVTEQQVELAAGLMGVSPDEVRPHVLEAARRPAAPRTERILAAPSNPLRGPRTVVIERRASRVPGARSPRPAGSWR